MDSQHNQETGHQQVASLTNAELKLEGLGNFDDIKWDQDISTIYRRIGRPYLRIYDQQQEFGSQKVSIVTSSPFQSYMMAKADDIAIDCTYCEIPEKNETLQELRRYAASMEKLRWITIARSPR